MLAEMSEKKASVTFIEVASLRNVSRNTNTINQVKVVSWVLNMVNQINPILQSFAERVWDY